LLASVLGTGNLNLPLRISHIGLLPFVVIIFMTALLSYLGMFLMSKFMVRYKVLSYSEMVRRAFGARIMRGA
jgi:amino acid permease